MTSLISLNLKEALERIPENTFFTGDQHHFHENIIKYCNRPYKTVKHMTESLIDRHNSVVPPHGTCYHLGDFTILHREQLRRIIKIVRRMNGRNILILGNHDGGKPFTYVNFGFESVHTSLILNNDIILVHDPATWNINPNKLWICAHVHNLFKVKTNCINVGVDQWDFKPVSVQQLLEV